MEEGSLSLARVEKRISGNYSSEAMSKSVCVQSDHGSESCSHLNNPEGTSREPWGAEGSMTCNFIVPRGGQPPATLKAGTVHRTYVNS